MSNNFIRHVQPQDPVSASVTSQPTRALEARLNRLESQFIAADTSAKSSIILPGVTIAPGVEIGHAVYYNPSTYRYELAVAQVTSRDGLFVFNPTAWVVGIVVAAPSGNVGDILVGGFISKPSGLKLEDGEIFVPGAQYYLSARSEGRVTRFSPAFRVQVFLASSDSIFLNIAFSNPDAVEQFHKQPIGMRPVGGIRTSAGDSQRFQIVGFDAIETIPGVVTAYQFTTQSSDRTCRDFGYMVADATITAKLSFPYYIRVHVPVTGPIGVSVADTLANLIAVTESTTLNEKANLRSSALKPVTGIGLSSDQYAYNVVLNGVMCGTVNFKFTTSDRSVARDVILKFPDSFQGWKMLNPPEMPEATAVVSGGLISSITVTKGGTGFTTPPMVVITPDSRDITAVPVMATAQLDVYGVVKSITVAPKRAIAAITVDTAGTGYTKADVTISAPAEGGLQATATAEVLDGRITKITVVEPGSGYLSLPTVTISYPDAPSSVVQTVVSNTAVVAKTQATATASLTASTISGYANPPTISFKQALQGVEVVSTGAGYRQSPTAVATLYAQYVDNIVVVHGGSGYTDPVSISVDMPAGTYVGVDITATVDALTGAITSVSLSDHFGPLYTVPRVWVSSAQAKGGEPAELMAIMAGSGSNGSGVYSIAVVDPGIGYITKPEVVLSAPELVGGEQATASATLNADGSIKSIDVDARGLGYIRPPTVSFQPSLPLVTVTDADTLAAIPGVVASSSLTLLRLQSVVRKGVGAGYDYPPTVLVDNPAGRDHNGDLYPWGDGHQNRRMASVVATLDGDGHIGHFAPDSILDSGNGFTDEVVLVDSDIVNPGSNYAFSATWTNISGMTFSDEYVIANPNNSAGNAAIMLQAVDGGITRVIVTKRGFGFTAGTLETAFAAVVAQLASMGDAGTNFYATPVYLKAPLIGLSGGGDGTNNKALHGRLLLLENQRVKLTQTELTALYPGRGYLRPPALVFSGGYGTGACGFCTIDNTTGGISKIYITNGGEGYTSAPTIGFLDIGGTYQEAAVGAVLNSVVVSGAGSAIAKLPITSLVGQFSTNADMFIPATVAPIIAGAGPKLFPNHGSQITDFATDFADGTLPLDAEFYYNVKADVGLGDYWPSIPAGRTTVVENGLELLSSELDQITQRFADSNPDVGVSNDTVFWTSANVSASPWDRSYAQYLQGIPNGLDCAIPGVGGAIMYWEHAYAKSVFINKAWLYINKVSRFHASGKVTSLSVTAPLRLIDLENGTDSNTNNLPMTGQLALSLDDRSNILSTPTQQINLCRTGQTAIWQNTTGKNVLISSVILQVVFQSLSSDVTVSAASAALVTIGTQAGGYLDIIGNSSALPTGLIGQGQYKELLPLSADPTAVVPPGDLVYLNVVVGASSPIAVQLVVARVKGQSL